MNNLQVIEFHILRLYLNTTYISYLLLHSKAFNYVFDKVSVGTVVPYPMDHITVPASIKDMASIQKVLFEYTHYGVFDPTFTRV